MQQAWELARPIKASFSDVKNIIVKSSQIEEKLNEKKNAILHPGGIYSIYSEKTQYGMGKSQFAYFIRELYGKNKTNLVSEYHIFSPSDTGFDDLQVKLKDCLSKCNRNNEFYFFIDELDLIDEPDISEENKAKRIERFGNIIIKISEEAYSNEYPFYIFLILSKHILEDFERLAPHRITRRITPFLSVDLLLTKTDVERFATNYFAMLWNSNYKNIQNKLNRLHFRFKEIIGEMITNIVNNLDFLGLDTRSSVIGDLVERFRNIFDIIFEDINDEHLSKVNLGNKNDVGNTIEKILKEYLLSKNRPFIFVEDEDTISVFYNTKEMSINGHKTDGYYDFRIGDNSIGIMPVEITTQENIKGRKRKQIVSFSENYITLLIWAYPDVDSVESDLEKLEEKIKHDVQRILIPEDLAQFIVLLEDRQFSLLEEFKKDIMSTINTYLKKYTRILYNRWMVGKPLPPEPPSPKGGEEGDEVPIKVDDLKNRVILLLENVFQFLDSAKSRRNHKGMRERLSKELKNLDDPLHEAGIVLPLFNIDIVYREMTEKLKQANLCGYTKLTDTSFISKKDDFTIDKAVGQCKEILIRRIESSLRNE